MNHSTKIIYRRPSRSVLITLPNTAFFYIIQHIRTGIYYAGAKYGKNHRAPNPSSFLLNDGYCTSSKKVLNIISLEGINAFEIRKIILFESSERARNYEHRFLKKVKIPHNSRFYNLHNAGKNWGAIEQHTDETKVKMSIASMGKSKSEEHKMAMRKPKSEKHKLNLAKANLGKTRSDESRQRARDAMQIRGMKWRNNGIQNKRTGICPGDNWYPGRIPFK